MRWILMQGPLQSLSSVPHPLSILSLSCPACPAPPHAAPAPAHPRKGFDCEGTAKQQWHISKLGVAGTEHAAAAVTLASCKPVPRPAARFGEDLQSLEGLR